MLNSRKLGVASQALTLIEQLETKFAALEIHHGIELMKAARDLIEQELCRICNGGGKWE